MYLKRPLNDNTVSFYTIDRLIPFRINVCNYVNAYLERKNTLIVPTRLLMCACMYAYVTSVHWGIVTSRYSWFLVASNVLCTNLSVCQLLKNVYSLTRYVSYYFTETPTRLLCIYVTIYVKRLHFLFGHMYEYVYVCQPSCLIQKSKKAEIFHIK